MQDKYPHMSELCPTWRRVDKIPPPKNVKLWFKCLHGQAVTGIWYDESKWAFWSPMPKHTPEDKAWILSQSNA